MNPGRLLAAVNIVTANQNIPRGAICVYMGNYLYNAIYAFVREEHRHIWNAFKTSLDCEDERSLSAEAG